MTTHRVMLVDDDDTLRTLLRTTLPEVGFEIVEAVDGAVALQRFAEGIPDLIVLDWNMPESSGSDVLRAVKGQHPEIPVVVLTAEKGAASRDLARSLGADAFLTKPFSPLELLGAIESLLRRP